MLAAVTARPLPTQNWLQSDINDTEGQPCVIAILVERAAQLYIVGMFSHILPNSSNHYKYNFEKTVSNVLFILEEKEVPIYMIRYSATVHTSFI